MTTLSRRTFLTIAGTVPLWARTARAASVPVGIELYTVRDALAKDLMGTVRAVAKLGYEVVEFYSPYSEWTPRRPSDVRKLLDELGHPVPVHAQRQQRVFTPDGMQKAIELNQIIGSKYVVMASPGQVPPADGWKAVADRLNAGAEQLEAARHGRRVPQPRRRVAGRLTASGRWTSWRRTRKNVALQFDVGTCVEAGADPVAWINAEPGADQEHALQGLDGGREGLRRAVRRGRRAVEEDLRGRRERSAASSST